MVERVLVVKGVGHGQVVAKVADGKLLRTETTLGESVPSRKTITVS